MKKVKIIRIALRSLFFVTALNVCVSGIISGQTKPKPTHTPSKTGRDLTKYAIADYEGVDAEDPKERKKREEIGKRYDQMHLVASKPHPDDGGVSVVDYLDRPLAIPALESNLIIIGEICSAKAFLSNNKRGVYTEFEVLSLEVLKGDDLKKTGYSRLISIDREGGYVRYPNGQKVFYWVSGFDLPKVGGRYLLFLTRKDDSTNYRILTGYELKADGADPLDNVSFSAWTIVTRYRSQSISEKRARNILSGLFGGELRN